MRNVRWVSREHHVPKFTFLVKVDRARHLGESELLNLTFSDVHDRELCNVLTELHRWHVTGEDRLRRQKQNDKQTPAKESQHLTFSLEKHVQVLPDIDWHNCVQFVLTHIVVQVGRCTETVAMRNPEKHVDISVQFFQLTPEHLAVSLHVASPFHIPQNKTMRTHHQLTCDRTLL